MAISIPIISSLDTKGFDKAAKEFASLDGAGAKAREAVHVLFANEKVKETDLVPAPDVDESVLIEAHRILSLESLVRMKLNVFRRKDQMHLIDMVSVGLIDGTWIHRYPPELATRLQQILDDPEG